MSGGACATENTATFVPPSTTVLSTLRRDNLTPWKIRSAGRAEETRVCSTCERRLCRVRCLRPKKQHGMEPCTTCCANGDTTVTGRLRDRRVGPTDIVCISKTVL